MTSCLSLAVSSAVPSPSKNCSSSHFHAAGRLPHAGLQLAAVRTLDKTGFQYRDGLVVTAGVNQSIDHGQLGRQVLWISAQGSAGVTDRFRLGVGLRQGGALAWLSSGSAGPLQPPRARNPMRQTAIPGGASLLITIDVAASSELVKHPPSIGEAHEIEQIPLRDGLVRWILARNHGFQLLAQLCQNGVHSDGTEPTTPSPFEVARLGDLPRSACRARPPREPLLLPRCWQQRPCPSSTIRSQRSTTRVLSETGKDRSGPFVRSRQASSEVAANANVIAAAITIACLTPEVLLGVGGVHGGGDVLLDFLEVSGRRRPISPIPPPRDRASRRSPGSLPGSGSRAHRVMAWPMCTWAMVGGRLVQPVTASNTQHGHQGREIFHSPGHSPLLLFQLTHQSKPDAVTAVILLKMIPRRHAHIRRRGEPRSAA